MDDGIFVRWSELLLDFRADFVLNNRRSYNLKVPITWSRRCTAENKMAEDSEEKFMCGDDFDAILAILEDDEAIDEAKMKLLIIILHQLIKK